MKSTNTLFIFTILFTFSSLAAAYVGPGAGLSLIGSLIAVLVAILIALGVILFWPIRFLIRKIRGTKVSSDTPQQETSSSTTDKVD